MATMRKREGKWQVQVRRKGFPAKSRTFILKSDAAEWARKMETPADRHELEPDRKVLDRTLLRDVILRYRDEVLPDKKGGLIEKIVLTAFLRHPICKKPLSRLSQADFADYRDQRLKTICPATFKRQLNPIRSALTLAQREWHLPLKRNPVIGLRVNATDKRRERRLRSDELGRIEDVSYGSRNRLVLPIVKFALETAMRRGEILALRWEHIDIESATLIIPDSKNGYARRIPLTGAAITILNGLDQTGEKVFPLAANALRLAWTRLLVRAEIEDLHFHDPRHEAISRLFEKGLTVPEAAAISGHRDMRMLFRYAHADYSTIQRKLA